ncbi:lasso peptide biosynthesis PqqD family chaperone [Streptomyces enissocaesilis]|uniref:Lasso peptide biosynthesis PqqD family chaperone n=1 Tax=Streptomyces enissocaesilis TaxID=332589 RepID=A0ABN3XQ84_9ACTN
MGITLRPGVVAAETEYGTALLDQSSGAYYTLNPTAALIMRTLLDGAPREQAVEQFAATYGISVREAGEDFTRIVEELHSARLLAS